MHILDADHETVLYTAKLKMRKPQIRMYSASTQEEIGTASFPVFSSGFDSVIHGQSIPIKSRGVLKNGHFFVSEALPGAKFTWKSTSKLNLVCEDERGVRVASYTWPSVSMRKGGRFDFFSPEVARDAVFEEILVTGLVIVQSNASAAQVAAVTY